MEQTLERFLKALRGMDVRVSLDESIEAHRTVALVGFDKRSVLRDALAMTVAKSEEEKVRFDDCFDMFFKVEGLENATAQNDGQSDESQSDEFSSPDADGTPQPGGGGDPQSLAELLLSGDRSAIAAAMAAAANASEISNIRLFTQRGVFMRRIMEGMGLKGLDQEIRELATGEPADQARAEQLEQARARLMEEVRDLVERQISLYADPASERLREEFLANARLSNIPPRDFTRVRNLVRRMAKRLASRHSRRRFDTHSGRLDVRRTIRSNVAYDGVPFRLAWRYTRIDRPRIVTICDVSGSVAAASQFLLLFLYSLNEVLSDLRAFAFSSHLEEVTDTLNNEDWESAVPIILDKIGFRSTDYGQTLTDLDAGYMDLIDRQTTVVILGDARNNDGEPHVELMQKIYERAKRVIWLNPEPKPFWGTGDSEMLRYQAYCHMVRVCSTIKDLERVVDDLLSSSNRAS
jgi:uncharacterized protein with von Willebrand factor type A (vWA) domain